MCKGPDGQIVTFGDMGKAGGSKAWTDASQGEKERRIQAGRLGGAATWNDASVEQKMMMREACASAWGDANEIEQEQRREPGRQVWEEATEIVKEGVYIKLNFDRRGEGGNNYYFYLFNSSPVWSRN